MAVGTIMPLPRFTGFDANGDPVPGGLLWTYQAGTSTPIATYSDVALTVPHANPIVLNSAGRPASGGSELGVYLTPGSAYKFVLQSAVGATIWTQDNVAAVPSSSLAVDIIGTAGEAIGINNCVYLSDGTGARTAGFWYLTDSDIVYMSSQPRQVGMATVNIPTGGQGTIRLEGAMTIPGAGMTPGATQYVHSIPGFLSPSVAQTYLRAVGVAQDPITLILGAGVGVQPAGIFVTITLTGTQHNLAIPAGCSVLNLQGTAALTLTGIAAGFQGQLLEIISTSNFQVDLLHQNAGSTLSNRFNNQATSGLTSLAADNAHGSSAHYLYTGNSWQLLRHEQGVWITPAYNAANWSGVGGMTWTVDAADVTTWKYRLQGHTLQVLFAFANTSVGGTLGPVLQVALPFTPTAAVYLPFFWGEGAGQTVGVAIVSAGVAFLQFVKLSGSWVAATNTTNMWGALTIEVN